MHNINQEINSLWKTIADFEEHEYINDSKNENLAFARRGARVDAYIVLQEQTISNYGDNFND